MKQVILHKELNSAAKIAALYAHCGTSVELLGTKRYLGGFFTRTVRLGWLWIVPSDRSWRVYKANGAMSHYAGSGPVLAADFNRQTGERVIGTLHISGVWKSEITMWPVTDEGEAVHIFDLIRGLVDLAYEQYVGSTVAAVLLPG